MAESKSAALEPVQGLFEAALGRNRDEWMLRMHRMGSCPCKQPGRPIARFRPNPSGKYLAGRSAALRRLPIARAIGCAPRLASHPGKVLARLQKDLEQVPTLGDRSTKGKRRRRRQESNLQSPVEKTRRPYPTGLLRHGWPWPGKRWHAWKESNPQPLVLETSALPVELHTQKRKMNRRSRGSASPFRLCLHATTAHGEPSMHVAALGDQSQHIPPGRACGRFRR